MSIQLKAIYMFDVIHLKNSNEILCRDRKINPKVHMKAQKTSSSQSNPEQKGNAGGIAIPAFKLYRHSALELCLQHSSNYKLHYKLTSNYTTEP
jgi:hypothetical protein